MAKQLTIVLAALAVACSAQQIASGLRSADAIGRGIAHVAGWCEEHGASPSDVVATVEAARDGDYSQALELAGKLVEAAKARGETVPDETATMLELAKEAYSARAIEQGMRALSGRDAEGRPK